MATFTYPGVSSGPAVGSVGAAGYNGPASGYNAWRVNNTGLNSLAANTATALTGAPPPDTALLQSITGDIGSLTAEGIQDQAASEASQTQSEGYQKEVDAYNTVGAIAGENAGIAEVSGNIKRLQANRDVQRTIGSQRAAVASAGFGASGSSLDIMRSSLQEGFLQDQIIGTQTALTKGGYIEEGAAAQAEAAGGMVASSAALSLSKAQAAAGQLATANAAKETAAIQEYISSTGGINSPSRALVTNTLDPTKTDTTFTPPTIAPAGAITRNTGSAYSGGIGTPYVG